MADGTKIEWTDSTWNVITGCDIESPGCKNCYAMRLAGTRLQHHPSRVGLTKPSAAGPVWTGEVRFNEQWLHQPLSWTRPRDIFVVAHGDLFHPNVPFDWIDKVFAVMALAPRHRFQVLTKRPAHAVEYLLHHAPAGYVRGAMFAAHKARTGGDPPTCPDYLWPLRNVLIGTSVESQRYASVRLPALRLLAANGWKTWCSYEPALGPVDWTGWEFVKWIVSGGESGHGARPHHPQWHRATRDFCAAHGIAFLFKQWGEWAPSAGDSTRDTFVDPEGFEQSQFELNGREAAMRNVGKAAAGRLLDGVEHNGSPA